MDTPTTNTSKLIEEKWQKKWAESRVFESDPKSGTDKKFITAAFPYPNSPQHIGHARTYTTTDIYVRYLRSKGYNVLFPMAFHVTGTPILAMARRIAEKDEDVLKVFENIYGISREKAATLTKPEDLVMYFSKEIEHGMHEMGYSIDWRRKFYSFDKKFNKFIQWQFQKLKKLGYLVQGEHPIAWCPKDNQAVGGHDTKGDIDPELKDFTAIKFGYKDGFILTATLRPETIYGVTNIWVNPDLDYVCAKSKKTGEIYYLGRQAFDKLNFQGYELEIIEEFKGKQLLKKKAKNLLTKESVPIYQAGYVKPDSGTGIVMSVPSHAPYDHVALLDLGIKLDYLQIIKVEGYKFMAQELIEKMGIKDQSDPRLEVIVKEVYKKEILTGTMVAGPYFGQKVSIAIEKTKEDLANKKFAIPFWEVNNKPVYCRCGAEVVATILKNQWFIDYGNAAWKTLAKECLENMSIVPQKNRSEYLYAIDWFKQKACARSQGLGTRFPFDEKLMIEALSDSTIYMSYYTISHMLADTSEADLDETFFDYVFAGRGIGSGRPAKMRESFAYWYPCDSRHSGADLIRNHLPFYIFNHVAIFEKKFWPKQIATNGFVLMDGTKMSKSMGNILPLRKAIGEYGADVIRFSVVAGAELSSDTNFSKSVAEGVRSRLEMIKKLIQESASGQMPIMSRMDYWISSRLNRRLAKAEQLYESMELRELSLEIFYDVVADLQWYVKRNKRHNLKDFFTNWTVLIAPFLPHHAEEFWEILGGKGFVSMASMPKSDPTLIDDKVEHGEELIKSVHADTERISGLIGKKPQQVTLVVASDWKRRLYAIAADNKTFDGILKTASAQGLPMKDAPNVVKAIMKSIHSLPLVLPQSSEFDALKDAQEFLGSEFSCDFVVLKEEDCQHQKSKMAMPGKPAIIME